MTEKDANIQFHKWLKDDTVKIKIMKMSKGYQWELSAEGLKATPVINRLKDVDIELRIIFGASES